jgi:hypothetical protein
MGQGRKEGPSYEITDPLALACALERAIARIGNLRKAAKLGSSRSTLSRILNGTAPALSESTFNALVRIMARADERAALYSAVMPPTALQLLHAARTSRSAELNAIRFRPTADRWRAEGNQLLSAKNGASYEGWRASFNPRDLESQLLVAKAKALNGYAKELTDLCDKREHADERIELAWYRIVAPLLEYRETGFVERAWWELDDDEFRLFIAAGIQREKILLSRLEDVRRAQHLAIKASHGRSPEEAKERSAPEWIGLILSRAKLTRDGGREIWDGTLEGAVVSPDGRMRARRTKRS